MSTKGEVGESQVWVVSSEDPRAKLRRESEIPDEIKLLNEANQDCEPRANRLPAERRDRNQY